MRSLIITEKSLLLPSLFQHFPELKKTKVKQLLKHGSVTVNGDVITAHNHPLKTGDTVEFLSKKTALREKIKLVLSFPIIYEDDSIIVIDKPEGLLTMGTDDDKFNTAYRELTDYVRTQSQKERTRIFIVHRLDRDASGLLVFAKNAKAKTFLQENWDEVIKKYYAVVPGAPEHDFGNIESYLVEDKFRRVYSTGKGEKDARKSLTQYQVIKKSPNYSMLDVTLVTGRKNQIRVHLADLGHPIIGDTKYGSDSNPAGRLGLHAYFLSLKHPETGEVKSFTIPLPYSLKRVLQAD